MPSLFSQVQQAGSVEAYLASLMGPVFKPNLEVKRRYPGESEGVFVIEYLRSLATAPKREKEFLTALRTLQRWAEAVENHDIRAIDNLRKQALKFAYGKLTGAINQRGWPEKVTEEGLVFKPQTEAGKAALAVLLLEKKGRLDRIRQCLHCGTWFYARFKHQQFCRDTEKRCQWNHYHSPVWRKLHREKNRKHQQEYRKRNPGRRH